MTIKNGFVQTPEEITKKLLEFEKFEGKILEPCCGKGAISEVLKSDGYEVISSDKFDYGYSNQRDVFDITESQKNIITNPPFNNKEAVEICKHLLTIYEDKLVLLWYLKNLGRILEGRTRIGLKNVYILGKVDWKETSLGWAFAWYVWEKGYEGDVTIKRIDWEQPIAQSQNSASQVVNDGFNRN